MKRALVIPACLGAALCWNVAVGYEVPKDITINRPEKNAPISAWVGPVAFPHGKHATLNACTACHHEESDRTLGQFLPCTQCHNQGGTKETTSAYRAWHDIRPMSCLGCHKQKRYKNEAMPPISCVRGCHNAPQGGEGS
ncbi:cytochrome c3 family protein [Megalodesulfovibrio paquesii]